MKDTSDMPLNRKVVVSWNRRNVWVESATKPHWCLPRDMKVGTPSDDAHGHWVIDPVDKWRFYVPNGGTTLYRKEYLEAMAIIATNIRPERESLLVRFLDGFFDFAGKFIGGLHG